MKTNLSLLALAASLVVSGSAFASGAQFRCTAAPRGNDYLHNQFGYGYAPTRQEAAQQALARCFSANGSDPAGRCSIVSCEKTH